MHNNENFGLTTGQETPTTPKNQPMQISPWGVISDRMNPLRLALASGSTFTASAWSGNQSHLKDMILAGMDHKGFSFINIYQHCPTYNKFEDQEWHKERVYDLATTDHDTADFMKAMQVAEYGEEKRAIGIIYQNKDSLPYMERIPYRSEFTTTLVDEVQKYDVTPLMEKFK
jgi:2-oxoglutarate ferredoxin oxidoreductase subunit beta